MDQWEVDVVGVESVGPRAVAVTLETPAGFTAKPGQFVLVKGTVDGESYARHYTLSSPAVADTFELTVGIDPDGVFSGWLADRRAGDTIDIEGPFGHVAYDGDGPVRVVVGGPGLGAGLGVAERAAAAGHAIAVVAAPEETGLVHQRRFAALASDHPIYVTDTPAGFAAAVARTYTAVPTGTTYVFGFRDFVERARDAIEVAGGDPDEAAIESYG